MKKVVKLPCGRKRVTHTFKHCDMLTEQHHAAACDINLIIKKFVKTGVLPDGVVRKPLYLDLSQPFEYADALQKVIDADNAFMSLPAVLRERFDNDPEKFLDFATDPANLKEMVDLGLAEEIKLHDSKQGVKTDSSASESASE